jgi:hypothetical protein
MGVRATSLVEIVEAIQETARLVERTAEVYPGAWKQGLRPGDRLIIQGAEVVTITRIEWREREQFVQVTSLFGPIWIETPQILGRAP